MAIYGGFGPQLLSGFANGTTQDAGLRVVADTNTNAGSGNTPPDRLFPTQNLIFPVKVASAPSPKTTLAIKVVGSGDTTAPTLDITVTPTKTKISRISGQDSTDFSFQVNEAYQAYQIRVVPSSSSPVTAGTLLESGSGGAANTNRAVTVTDDEFVAAGGVEGTSVIKVFAQDTAGNWST